MLSILHMLRLQYCTYFEQRTVQTGIEYTYILFVHYIYKVHVLYELLTTINRFIGLKKFVKALHVEVWAGV
jgi:hypothetical protein